VLTRRAEETVEILVLTFWDSMEAAPAVLREFDREVTHWIVRIDTEPV
jgi:hypothetical protein